jgi:chromosome condensin MukBEF ATPase and DNA-binding subunit MukB
MEDNKTKRKQKRIETNLRIFLLKKIIYKKEQETYSDALEINCSDDLFEEMEQELNDEENKQTETKKRKLEFDESPTKRFKRNDKLY